MIDDAIMIAKHHLPNQRHGHGRQQRREEQRNTKYFYAPFQAFYKHGQRQSQSDFNRNRQRHELHRVPDRFKKHFVLNNLNIIGKPDKLLGFAGQIIIIGKAVQDRITDWKNR
ncbi:hypothetical protein D3C77_455110 [compost metagenome]